MKTIFDILLFPLSVVFEAFAGILYPVKSPKMRSHRKWALVSLAGGTGVLGLVLLQMAFNPHSPVMAPLIGVGLLFLFVFLIAGKACADEAENGKK
jgi:hypothetical protein